MVARLESLSTGKISLCLLESKDYLSIMQELITGDNSIEKLPGLVASHGKVSVFIITGQHFVKKADELFAGKINFYHFIKQGVNVEGEEAEKTFEQFIAAGSEVLLAIGGGSVIDLAKAVIYGCIKNNIPVPFFIVAPTTAGSGTEATQFAVVYKGKKKFSLSHSGMLPALVILDPVLTYSLNPLQTAISGMDVLSQAVESYWNLHANPESKELSRECIALWNEYFLEAVKEPDSLSREKMLWASHLAGKAINITRTTGPHALSYFLTANFGVPHGQAVALFLPLFFLYNEPDNELLRMLGYETAYKAKEKIERTMSEAGLATRLSELGIDKEAIMHSLLEDVNEERFANNPVPFNKEKLERLINENL